MLCFWQGRSLGESLKFLREDGSPVNTKIVEEVDWDIRNAYVTGMLCGSGTVRHLWGEYSCIHVVLLQSEIVAFVTIM